MSILTIPVPRLLQYAAVPDHAPVPPRSPAAGSAALRLLLSTSRRFQQAADGWLLLPVAGAGIGAWLGADLGRGAEPTALADPLFFVTLALVAPLPMTAVGALYHHPLHALLLPWPVSAGQHLRLGLRQLLHTQLAGAAAALAFALGAGLSGDLGLSGPALLPALFAALVYLGGLCAAVGCAGLCATLAAARDCLIARIRDQAAGPFASGRHAPFFYLPALAFFVTAFAALPAQAGLLRLLCPAGAHGPPGGLWTSLALLAAPLVAGLVLAAIGALGYRAHALVVIPRVIEEARTVYGGRPAPADPPYGLWLARLLPRTVAAHYGRELREQARAHRGLWPLLVLGMVAALAYAVNVGAPLGAAPLAAVLLVVWAAGLPVRRTPRQSGAAFSLTLPRPALASWIGRLLALLFAAGHLGLAVVAAIGLRHGVRVAAPLGALLLATAAAAVGASTPRCRRQPADLALRWGVDARLVPVAALTAGLVASLGWPEIGLAAIVALGTVGFALGLGLGTVRGARR